MKIYLKETQHARYVKASLSDFNVVEVVDLYALQNGCFRWGEIDEDGWQELDGNPEAIEMLLSGEPPTIIEQAHRKLIDLSNLLRRKEEYEARPKIYNTAYQSTIEALGDLKSELAVLKQELFRFLNETAKEDIKIKDEFDRLADERAWIHFHLGGKTDADKRIGLHHELSANAIFLRINNTRQEEVLKKWNAANEMYGQLDRALS